MASLFHNEIGFDSSIMFVVLSCIDCLGVVKLGLVCKNWYHSIRSVEFSNFYNRFGETPDSKFLLQGVSREIGSYNKTFMLISPPLELEKNYSVLIPHPLIGVDHDYELVGSINGIICLQRYDVNGACVFMLCNPLIGVRFETISPARRTSSGTILYGFSYNIRDNQFCIVVLWKGTSQSGGSISLISSLSSDNRVWTNESEFLFDIDMISGRCVHNLGRLYWLGREHRSDDVFGGYFVVSYDPANRVSERHDFDFAEDGVCVAIANVGDKISVVYRVPNEYIDEDRMQLWISQHGLVPNHSNSIFKVYDAIMPGFNFIGFIGGSIFCSPPHCYCRATVRIIICHHDFRVYQLKEIKSDSPKNFYFDYITEHFHSLAVL